MKVYIVLKQGINIKTMFLTTYSNLEMRKRIYAGLSGRVGQDRNCHRKPCLLNCWSLLLLVIVIVGNCCCWSLLSLVIVIVVHCYCCSLFIVF